MGSIFSRSQEHRVLERIGPALLLVFAACSSPTDLSEGADLIVAGAESGRIYFVNTREGAVVNVAHFTLGPLLASTVNSNNSTAFLTTINSGRQLIAFDLHSGTIRWRLPMADVAHPVSYDGIQLFADPIALLADDRTLAMGNSLRSDSLGIARFDPITKGVTQYRAPLGAMGFQVSPPRFWQLWSRLAGARTEESVPACCCSVQRICGQSIRSYRTLPLMILSKSSQNQTGTAYISAITRISIRILFKSAA